MADYYPLIARAVEGLGDHTPETRQAVYDRARTALVAQLRSLTPPPSEAGIRRECASLEEAIARVEADYASAPAGAGQAEEPSGETGFEPTAAQALPAASVHGLRAPSQDDAGPDDAEPDFMEPGPAESAAMRPKVDSRPHPAMQSGKRMKTVLFGAVLAVVILGIALLAWWKSQSDPALPAEEQTVAEASQPDQQEAAKIEERVGGQAPPASAAQDSSAQEEIGIAQRAVFYEEDASNPQAPKAQVGRVVWRLEDENPGQGQSLEKVVRATVEIPDAGLEMKMVIRRNLDATLPASHTIELSFTTREGESGRAIRDVGLLQLKNEEAARGTPIAGLPVPVRENLFLIGLSNLQGDIERNTELFVRRNWIDLPVRMASGQRAILSFEKGASGEQVLTGAFSQW